MGRSYPIQLKGYEKHDMISTLRAVATSVRELKTQCRVRYFLDFDLKICSGQVCISMISELLFCRTTNTKGQLISE